MSIRSINGLTGGSTNVYVNSMFEDGESIEVVQTSNTTKATVNVAMKSNTTQTATLNGDDWMIISDNATGKIIKRILVSDIKNAATHWTLSTNELYPDLTSYNLLVGTSTNTNSRKFLCTGTGEFTGVLTLGNKINDLTLPTGTKTLATLTGVETFTNKTLTTPIISELNKASDGYTMAVPAPDGTGETLLTDKKTQTVFSKTLSTSCTWNGNTIAYNYGGTGQTTWTKGDILYANNNNSLAKLGIGYDGAVLKIASGLPSWGTDNDTNYFTKSGSNIYPTNTSENFLVGTTSNGVSAKLYVDGDAYLVGDEIVITGEKNSSGSSSTTFTLNGKAYEATGGTMTAYTEMIKLVNPQKSGGSDKDPTLSLKAGHLELRGTETDGTTRLDCFGINAKMFNATSGAVEDYDDIINVINCIAGGSTNYPKLQMKLDNTNGSNGQVLTVNASGHCSWQTPSTSQWTLSSSSLYPNSTASNVLIGTTSNPSSRKLIVNGASEFNGIMKNTYAGLNSFQFINGNFYNDANRTIHLEHDASQYGYTHTAYDSAPAIYSDVSTYATSSGTAIASIGSQSTSRFALFADETYFIAAVPTSRNWVTLGQAIGTSSSHTPLSQFHICNNLSDLNSGDSRITVQSLSSSHDASLLFSVNSASDGSGSASETEIYGDSNADLNLRGAEVKVRDNSATEKFRFTSTSNIAIGTTLASTITPPTTQGNTALTGVQIGGGNGSSIVQRWAGASGADGTRYYMCNFIPPYHTGGPWGFWTEDDGSASNFGLSYGSTFLWYVNSSSALVGASTWTGSDERIKEDIVNADTTECMNIIKRLPLKQYKYKKVLRDNCSGFTQSEVFGWIAQDVKADPVMNYASNTTCDTKYYDKETNSKLEYEVKDLEIINKPSLNAVSWGAISGLIDIVEAQKIQINQQQAIIDKLINAPSFKAFRESL